MVDNDEHGQQHPAQTSPTRWAALIVLCAGLLMVILDGTVVTVALPSIQRELGFSAADLELGGRGLPDPVRRVAVAGRAAR